MNLHSSDPSSDPSPVPNLGEVDLPAKEEIRTEEHLEDQGLSEVPSPTQPKETESSPVPKPKRKPRKTELQSLLEEAARQLPTESARRPRFAAFALATKEGCDQGTELFEALAADFDELNGAVMAGLPPKELHGRGEKKRIIPEKQATGPA